MMIDGALVAVDPSRTYPSLKGAGQLLGQSWMALTGNQALDIQRSRILEPNGS